MDSKNSKMNIPLNGMVLHLPFNEISNDNTVLDQSGNNLVATAHGHPKVVGDSTFINCVELNGEGDCFSIPDDEKLRISPYTVAIWIKPNGAPNEQYKGIVGKRGRNYNIWLSSRLFINQSFSDGNGRYSSPANTAPNSITPDQWNHVAITNDGTYARTYIDGVLEAEGKSYGMPNVHNTILNIGRNCDGNSIQFFKGQLAHLLIYNRPLPVEEIKQIKEEMEQQGIKPIIQLPMDKIVDNVLNDESVNKLNATIHGSPEIISDPLFGSSVNLDGTGDYFTIPDTGKLRISPYTVSIWLKTDGVPGETWTGIVGKPGRNFNIWLTNAGFIHHRFHNRAGVNSGTPDTTAGSISWNQWHHVAITNDGTTAKTYIDGIIKAKGPAGGMPIIDNTDLIIGKNLDGNAGNHFKGQLASLRIYYGALPPDEIRRIKEQTELQESNPILLLPMDKIVDNSLKDKSENKLNAAVRGTPKISPDDLFGSCVTLDGTSSYFTIPDSGKLRTSPYTVSIWFKTNGVPNGTWTGIVGKPGRNFNIWLNNRGFIHHRFHIPGNANFGAPDTPAGSISWDQWNHVVITNDGTIARTYIDGNIKAEGTARRLPVINKSDLIIGRNLDGNAGNYFEGQLADLRIYDRALSSVEIRYI